MTGNIIWTVKTAVITLIHNRFSSGTKKKTNLETLEKKASYENKHGIISMTITGT